MNSVYSSLQGISDREETLLRGISSRDQKVMIEALFVGNDISLKENSNKHSQQHTYSWLLKIE